MKLKRSQYFKMWLEEKQVPFLVVPLLATLLIGIIILVIGGTVAGWNIGGALVSKTAFLFYIVLIVLTAFVLYDWLSKKNQR